MEELLHELPLPTFQQFMFVQVALFTALMAILVVVAKNLFHSALSLVGTLFGVAGIYILLEAEFLAVSQILVYVGGISTLITFAIMLTRSMMFGDTAPINRQAGTAAIIIGTLFSVLAGLVAVIPWPGPAEPLLPAMAISDVASIVAGEKSVQFITADTELSTAEAVLADAEAALEAAETDADKTKAEKALAEANAARTETKGELDIVIAKAAVANAGTVLADAETALEAATIDADKTKAEEVLAEAQAVLAKRKATLVATEEQLAEAMAKFEEPDAEADVAADAEEADIADAEEMDVAEAEEADEAKTDVADADAAEADVVEADADAVEADVAEAEAADMSADETAISADIVAAAPPLPLVERNGKSDGEVLIAGLGQLFVTTYLVPFELMALLLLVVLAGAIMLARDRV